MQTAITDDAQPSKAWGQDEVERLLSVAVGGTYEAWLRFSLETGVRSNEARELRWLDVDLRAKTVTIRALGKAARWRVLTLSDQLGHCLEMQRRRQTPGAAFVFGEGVRPCSLWTLHRWLASRCEAAGVRTLPTHVLRVTFAQLARDAGVPWSEIARTLGVADPSATRLAVIRVGEMEAEHGEYRG